MATRKFCDWCDSHIEDHRQFFSVELLESGKSEFDAPMTVYHNSSPDNSIPSKSVAIELLSTMVCVNCAGEVRKLILSKQK